MKMVCPVCGIIGAVQQRGRSCRIQHYVGFREGKRVYLYHKVGLMDVTDGRNGRKTVDINKAVNVL
jgi:hypothetical protein